MDVKPHILWRLDGHSEQFCDERCLAQAVSSVGIVNLRLIVAFFDRKITQKWGLSPPFEFHFSFSFFPKRVQ